MDTLKERTALEEQYRSGVSPWAVWRDRPRGTGTRDRPGRDARAQCRRCPVAVQRSAGAVAP